MIDGYVTARIQDSAPEIYTVVILGSHEGAFLRGNDTVALGTKLEPRHSKLSRAAVVVKASITEVVRSGRKASPGDKITILYRRDISIVEVRGNGTLVYEDAMLIGGSPNWNLKAGHVVAVYLEPDGNGCYRPVMDGYGIANNDDLWKRHLENPTSKELGELTLEDHSIPAELRRFALFCRRAQPDCQVVFTPQDEQTYWVNVRIPYPQDLLNRKIKLENLRFNADSDNQLWRFLEFLSFGKIKRPEARGVGLPQKS